MLLLLIQFPSLTMSLSKCYLTPPSVFGVFGWTNSQSKQAVCCVSQERKHSFKDSCTLPIHQSIISLTVLTAYKRRLCMSGPITRIKYYRIARKYELVFSKFKFDSQKESHILNRNQFRGFDTEIINWASSYQFILNARCNSFFRMMPSGHILPNIANIPVRLDF